MKAVMRVLVTGSRSYPEPGDVTKALFAALVLCRKHEMTLTVVHGDYKTGADHFASEWCAAHPEVIEEKHPADWGTYGRAAGPIRNNDMVKLGADLVLAFPLAGDKKLSPGTWRTIEAAKRANINVGVKAA